MDTSVANVTMFMLVDEVGPVVAKEYTGTDTGGGGGIFNASTEHIRSK